MPKQSGLYATQPVAKAKRLATSNPVGSPGMGSFPSPTVPAKAGQLHGLGQMEKPFREHSVKGSHGFGHVGSQKSGHLRLSGYTDAHRLGVSAKAPGSPKPVR